VQTDGRAGMAQHNHRCTGDGGVDATGEADTRAVMLRPDEATQQQPFARRRCALYLAMVSMTNQSSMREVDGRWTTQSRSVIGQTKKIQQQWIGCTQRDGTTMVVRPDRVAQGAWQVEGADVVHGGSRMHGVKGTDADQHGGDGQIRLIAATCQILLPPWQHRGEACGCAWPPPR
jgi:hypothetical protein